MSPRATPAPRSCRACAGPDVAVSVFHGVFHLSRTIPLRDRLRRKLGKCQLCEQSRKRAFTEHRVEAGSVPESLPCLRGQEGVGRRLGIPRHRRPVRLWATGRRPWRSTEEPIPQDEASTVRRRPLDPSLFNMQARQDSHLTPPQFCSTGCQPAPALANCHATCAGTVLPKRARMTVQLPRCCHPRPLGFESWPNCPRNIPELAGSSARRGNQ